jgi:MtN3 and saliva related transmembrane protein
MNSGLHHLRVRQRWGEGREPFPARSRLLRSLDRLMFIVAIFSPAAFLPQVIHIFKDKDVAGLSIATWVILTVINSLWAIYGFVHRDKPVFIANVLIALLDVCIVIGILWYSA